MSVSMSARPATHAGRPETATDNAGAPLPTRLVALLERAILGGEFKNGERLEEEILVARYGVSRASVRETPDLAGLLEPDSVLPSG